MIYVKAFPMNTDEIMARVLPQFFPEHWLKDSEIVFSDFPSRIRIGYVLREEGQYSYILRGQFAEMRTTLEHLHVTALTNLSELSSANISIAKVPAGAEGWISATDDNFAAARILIPEVRREFREALGEPFLVPLPHRDDCVCWSIKQPVERQQKHTREALERFLHDDYNLTPDILLCSDDHFRVSISQL